MLRFETVIKSLCDFIHIKRRSYPARYIHHGDGFFLLHADCYLIKPLNKRIACLIYLKAMIPAGQRFARFTANPVPNLTANRLICVNNEMFSNRLRNFMVDFQACGPVGNLRTENATNPRFCAIAFKTKVVSPDGISNRA